MTMAVHDIFFAVTLLEKMQGIGKIMFASLRVNVEHKIGRCLDNNIFKPDGIEAWTLFEIELLDSDFNAGVQIFRRQALNEIVKPRAIQINVRIGFYAVAVDEMMLHSHNAV